MIQNHLYFLSICFLRIFLSVNSRNSYLKFDKQRGDRHFVSKKAICYFVHNSRLYLYAFGAWELSFSLNIIALLYAV